MHYYPYKIYCKAWPKSVTISTLEEGDRRSKKAKMKISCAVILLGLVFVNFVTAEVINMAFFSLKWGAAGITTQGLNC